MVNIPELGPIFAHQGESVHIDKPGHQPAAAVASQPQPITIHQTIVLDGKVLEKKIIKTVSKAPRLGDLPGDLTDPRA